MKNKNKALVSCEVIFTPHTDTAFGSDGAVEVAVESPSCHAPTTARMKLSTSSGDVKPLPIDAIATNAKQLHQQKKI
jgi:hypothetical protein